MLLVSTKLDLEASSIPVGSKLFLFTECACMPITLPALRVSMRCMMQLSYIQDFRSVSKARSWRVDCARGPLERLTERRENSRLGE